MKNWSPPPIAAVLVFIFFSTILFGYGESVNSDETYIVDIYGHAVSGSRELRVQPDNLIVPKDAVVVWVNWARVPEVKVIFTEGKKCEEVTAGQVGFKLEASGCYVTKLVTLGETSSLRFLQEGTYNYEVEAPNLTKVTGSIGVTK